MNMNDRIFQERSPGLIILLVAWAINRLIKRPFYTMVNWLRDWVAKKDINNDSTGKGDILIKISVLLLILLLFANIVGAECFSDCMFQPGTICVNGKCVPVQPLVPTPELNPTPAKEIQVPSNAVIVTVQKLYCDDRVCIIFVAPPGYLNTLTKSVSK